MMVASRRLTLTVMVTWTLGRRNLLHALDALKVQHIVTAHALLARIRAQGTSLEDIEDRFLAIEDLRRQMTPGDKLWALGQTYFNWSALRRVTVPDTAAVLFTSGSESVPKAVPLSHRRYLVVPPAGKGTSPSPLPGSRRLANQ